MGHAENPAQQNQPLISHRQQIPSVKRGASSQNCIAVWMLITPAQLRDCCVANTWLDCSTCRHGRQSEEQEGVGGSRAHCCFRLRQLATERSCCFASIPHGAQLSLSQSICICQSQSVNPRCGRRKKHTFRFPRGGTFSGSRCQVMLLVGSAICNW